MAPRKPRQRGHIGQLPSWSYRVVVYAGLDPLTRKPLQVRETARTYEEAEKVLTRLQREVDEDQAPKSLSPWTRWPGEGFSGAGLSHCLRCRLTSAR